MIKIAPSILSASFNSIEQEIRDVAKAGADLIHLDIMDGVFVPNITFGPLVIKDMPKLDGIAYDAHLMITQPENSIQAFLDLDIVDIVCVHVESTIHLQRLLTLIRDCGKSPAVALNPSTPLSALDWILEDVDMVLIMSVNPGYGGQKFIPASLKKIETLKETIVHRGLSIEIEVDGGAYPGNIRQLANAGVDIAVAGSAVFNQPDYSEAIQNLKSS